jgi:hypothetical protein
MVAARNGRSKKFSGSVPRSRNSRSDLHECSRIRGLLADDGQLFRNPVSEGLPTNRPESLVVVQFKLHHYRIVGRPACNVRCRL